MRGRDRRGVGALAIGVVVALCAIAHGADEPTIDDCLACHREPADAADGRRVAPIAGAGYRAAAHADLDCTTCHDDATELPHDPLKPVGLAVCTACHDDAVEEFRRGVHAGVASPGAAGCGGCHGDLPVVRPHDDPAAEMSRTQMARACARCHADQRVVEEHRIPIARPGLTILGMVAHNVLDLSRKARTPLPPPPPLPDVAERMPRVLRWQHRSVTLSFPVLVYTGFALTYSDHRWAAPFVAWETHFGLRGLLHRVAAVILMGAVVWHATYVATNPPLRACLRGLVPTRNDLRVAIATLAYHLGRRPHPPRSGTFNYAEKIEYWAFLWGPLGGRPPTLDDLPRLRYARMVVEESMRLYPPVWAFGRQALEEDQVGGYRIAAGSPLNVIPWLTHRHPDFWPDLGRFDPERFAPERTTARHRFAYLPFSGGPRLCIGNEFALMEAVLLVAMTVQRYRVALADPERPIEPDVKVTLRPRGGMPVRIRAA